MSELAYKIVQLHKSLARAKLPHAFGGALALAWCTGRARGTIDIDVNIFVAPADVVAVIAALPSEIAVSKASAKRLKTEGQERVWWDRTPVDIFLNCTPWHATLSERVKVESFAGSKIPFLGCSELAVFKAFFNRTKDWADIEEMLAEQTIDTRYVINTLATLLGNDEGRIRQFLRLAGIDSEE